MPAAAGRAPTPGNAAYILYKPASDLLYHACADLRTDKERAPPGRQAGKRLTRTRGNARLFGNWRHNPPKIPSGREKVVNHRSEEHTSELQSLMRISYAVFCLQKKHI